MYIEQVGIEGFCGNIEPFIKFDTAAFDPNDPGFSILLYNFEM